MPIGAGLGRSATADRAESVARLLAGGGLGDAGGFEGLVEARRGSADTIRSLLGELGQGQADVIRRAGRAAQGTSQARLAGRGFLGSNLAGVQQAEIEGGTQSALSQLASDLLGQRLGVQGQLDEQEFFQRQADTDRFNVQRLLAAQIFGGEFQTSIADQLDAFKSSKDRPFISYR